MAGGYIYTKARLPQGVKCQQCGSKNVKSGLLSKLLY